MGSSNDKEVKVLEHQENLVKLRKEIEGKFLDRYEGNLVYKDIELDYYGKNFCHVLCLNENFIDPRKPNILLIHGFQGTSISFNFMMNELKEYGNLYSIDLLGMANSSRPQVHDLFKNASEWIEFYVGFIEKVVESLKFDKFYLIGHSLGGLLSGWYSVKNPEKVIKLTLFSPAGTTDFLKKNNDGTITEIKDHLQFGRTFAYTILNLIFKLKITFQDIYCIKIFNSWIKKGIIKRYRHIGVEENDIYGQLTEQIAQLPKDLDKMIFFVISNPVPSATLPLEDKFEKLVSENNFKIDYYYGENDWMEYLGAQRLHQKFASNINFIIVTNSGHTFQIESPIKAAKLFLENNKELIEMRNKRLEEDHLKKVDTIENVPDKMLSLKSFSDNNINNADIKGDIDDEYFEEQIDDLIRKDEMNYEQFVDKIVKHNSHNSNSESHEKEEEVNQKI